MRVFLLAAAIFVCSSLPGFAMSGDWRPDQTISEGPQGLLRVQAFLS